MDNKRTFNFTDGLQLLFLYLKLTGQIDWSWWLVLSPLVYTIIIWILVLIVSRFEDKW